MEAPSLRYYKYPNTLGCYDPSNPTLQDTLFCGAIVKAYAETHIIKEGLSLSCDGVSSRLSNPSANYSRGGDGGSDGDSGCCDGDGCHDGGTSHGDGDSCHGERDDGRGDGDDGNGDAGGHGAGDGGHENGDGGCGDGGGGHDDRDDGHSDGGGDDEDSGDGKGNGKSGVDKSHKKGKKKVKKGRKDEKGGRDKSSSGRFPLAISQAKHKVDRSKGFTKGSEKGSEYGDDPSSAQSEGEEDIPDSDSFTSTNEWLEQPCKFSAGARAKKAKYDGNRVIASKAVKNKQHTIPPTKPVYSTPPLLPDHGQRQLKLDESPPSVESNTVSNDTGQEYSSAVQQNTSSSMTTGQKYSSAVEQDTSSNTTIIQEYSSACAVEQSTSSNTTIQEYFSAVEQNTSSNTTIIQEYSSACAVEQDTSSNTTIFQEYLSAVEQSSSSSTTTGQQELEVVWKEKAPSCQNGLSSGENSTGPSGFPPAETSTVPISDTANHDFATPQECSGNGTAAICTNADTWTSSDQPPCAGGAQTASFANAAAVSAPHNCSPEALDELAVSTMLPNVRVFAENVQQPFNSVSLLCV